MLSQQCHMSGACALGKRQHRPQSPSCSCKLLCVQLPADGPKLSSTSAKFACPAMLCHSQEISLKGIRPVHVALLSISPSSWQIGRSCPEREANRTCQ